ncbi:MAG: type II toxin-antitoxin system RelE/ParE family toxin [Chloroflexi bacterium]|nr:type II toxin-antitoxin system RelE/ParE family toxin [Chloroflexota bacterium]
MASFRIEWKQSAVKELEKLPKPAVLRIISAIQQLSEMPTPQGTRKLAGASRTYRIRVGNYRVVLRYFRINAGRSNHSGKA